ncbi:rCG33775, partial [Rattus norvegicus]
MGGLLVREPSGSSPVGKSLGSLEGDALCHTPMPQVSLFIVLVGFTQF